MSTATTLSRVTGFVRMWATALALAVSGLASAYNVANNIPNMIFELVAGGILSSLFIPTFLEVNAQRDQDSAWRFASHVFNLSVFTLGIVAIVGMIWPEPFIWTQTFRMSAEKAATVRPQAELFFRFFAIQVVIYGGGMVVQGLLNAQRRYFWVALGPVFNNLIVIVSMIAFRLIAPSDPDLALIVVAAGTTLGVVVMFAVMIPDLLKGRVRYTFEFGLSDPAVRRMLRLAVPTVVYVVTNLVGVSFRNASSLAVGVEGPSTLMYAWTFFQLPYGILAVALATAVFTELSDASGRNDLPALKEHFRKGLRSTAVLMLPASALLMVLSEPLISLYRAGAFRAEDIAPVAAALRSWSVGLDCYACMMFTLRTF
jgi:putative peptidoglycan lipid II flippase